MRLRKCTLCGESIEQDINSVDHANIWRIPGRSVRIPLSSHLLDRRTSKEIDEMVHQTVEGVVDRYRRHLPEPEDAR